MFRSTARASGGAGQGWGLPGPGLVEVVVLGEGVGLGEIERRGLIEVVGEALLGGLLRFPTTGAHLEFSLGRPPGGMNQRRRGGFTDVGKDPGDGLRLREERDEREGGSTGGADQREDLIDACKQSRPHGGSRGGG